MAKKTALRWRKGVRAVISPKTIKNVYVLGCEPFNFSLLNEIERDESVRFLELMSLGEAESVGRVYGFDELVELAEQRMSEGGAPDAILNYWDFPGCCLAPTLCHEHGLPAANLESVAACEHKYWSRIEMCASIPDCAPRFAAVDPFANDPEAAINIPYPYWLKPIVSHSSYLGFKISNRDDLLHALALIRQEIATFGAPFDEFLKRVSPPASVNGVGGQHCIAEEIISADAQVTLEGYVKGGEVVVYGYIDSIREEHAQSSFARYEYPSRLPENVLGKMTEWATRYLTHIGY